MKDLVYRSRSVASKQTGLSYLGGVASSSKIEKSLKYMESTYILYLAPANLSGYEVCPMRTEGCTTACLNTSGRVRMDVKNIIQDARIKKTKLFFENRDFFMRWMIDEISSFRDKAARDGYTFSVRLNGTSDLDPRQFHLNGQNILQLFPDVKFYDYTKVKKRFELMDKYSNYDLTYSFSGKNMVECLDVLMSGRGRVAMVFEDKLPSKYVGVQVIDGDLYDMRHVDKHGVIVGLKFKKIKGNPDLTNNDFVIKLK